MYTHTHAAAIHIHVKSWLYKTRLVMSKAQMKVLLLLLSLNDYIIWAAPRRRYKPSTRIMIMRVYKRTRYIKKKPILQLSAYC